ncbi:sensor histidine kinase/response regulator, putative [Aspergillus oryzae 100-8]|uniref:Sensor histidine kinase/response regulator, putative n=1 Tax=Aspergillus oryzae (strain 3.042) TaxID=1160506 RepID=I7ZUP6_ASPO3|nr:sensor histidine kinase/response regulator, putative [Aspergillus oryzae 3.042]KDE86103.1 sensor histidine kinase/response regulator, putative [Aspergillus oryzae 100-8]|eukprot:EIT75824.1 sensor histidine kinase/response regulator, putative [Aspergillus oryzae 3.042]
MKKAGFAYESAVNGLEAVQKAESETFQAIIMGNQDLSMPVMDGVTASRKIREYEDNNSLRPVTIIALTAVDTPAMKRDAMRSGIDVFLTKPANMNRLKEIISSLGT